MSERFMELAQEQQERTEAAAVAKVRAAAAPESDPDFDGEHCVEARCGDTIPAARLALGKIRCVTCQTVRERSKHRS